MKPQDNNRGMTILEIMIVVSIIAVVASILAYSISSVREKIRIEQATQDLQRLSSAIEQLAFDTGKWPGGLSRTTKDKEVWDLREAQSGILTNDGTFKSEWKGPYLDEVPTDPWGNPYFFDSDYWWKGSGTNIVVVVGSFGPNKVGRNMYDSDDICIEMTWRQ